MCRHIYDWNIVYCDVKQPIHLNSILEEIILFMNDATTWLRGCLISSIALNMSWILSLISADIAQFGQLIDFVDGWSKGSWLDSNARHFFVPFNKLIARLIAYVFTD